MNKRLTRKAEGQMVCGVCSGFGDYFGIDPTIIRILVAASFFSGGIGFFAYIAAAVIMPTD